MTKKSIKNYFEEAAEEYKKARAEWAPLNEKYQETIKQIAEVQKDWRMSAQGKKEAVEKLKEKKEGLERQMIAINQGNQNKMKAIRKRLENDFKGFYGIDPDQLDMKAVALLNSGVLRRSDLSQMAEKYADNVGMLRLIGKEAKKYENERDMQLLAARCSKDKPSVHLEKFDGFSHWTHVGLGGDPNGNIGYARFAQKFDDELNERLDGFIASLPDVVRCSDSEHGVWYTSENN